MSFFQRHGLALVALITLFSTPCFAQVATPPLDPSQPVLMPAANSWRYVKGSNEKDDKRTATLAMGTNKKVRSNADKSVEWNETGSQGILLAQTENVNIEASFIPSQTITQTSTNPAGAQSISKSKISGSTIGFAYLAKAISFGASYRTSDYQPGTQNTEKETGNGASITAQLANVFFFAWGIEQVKQAETYKSANKWNQSAYALALMAGKPDETQLRLEYSNLHSPKSVAQITGQKNIHPETFRTLLSAEVKMGPILLSYQSDGVRNLEIATESVPGYNTSNRKIGFGWVPANGLILSLYQTTETKDSTWSSYQDREGTRSDLNIGYNF